MATTKELDSISVDVKADNGLKRQLGFELTIFNPSEIPAMEKAARAINKGLIEAGYHTRLIFNYRLEVEEEQE